MSEIATESHAEGDELAMPREWGDAFDRLPPAVFEWVNLAGLDYNYDIPGIDYRPSHRLGDEWVAEQRAYRERVASTRKLSPRDDPSVLFRLIIARQLRLATGEAPSATFEPAEAQTGFRVRSTEQASSPLSRLSKSCRTCCMTPTGTRRTAFASTTASTFSNSD